jgi:hypothetical protein
MTAFPTISSASECNAANVIFSGPALVGWDIRAAARPRRFAAGRFHTQFVAIEHGRLKTPGPGGHGRDPSSVRTAVSFRSDRTLDSSTCEIVHTSNVALG